MSHYYQIILKTDQTEQVWSMQSSRFRTSADRLLANAERLSPQEKGELDNYLYDNVIRPCFGKDGDLVFGSALMDALALALYHKPSQLIFLSEDIRSLAQLKEQLSPEIVVPQILYTYFNEAVPACDFEEPAAPFS